MAKMKSKQHKAAGRRGGMARWKKHREPTIQKYLLARVLVAMDGCWNWTLTKDEDGYGKGSYKGIGFSAHRGAYEAFVKPIAKGKIIRHKCDNPSCINPKHLLQGTHQENMQDLYKRNSIGVERIKNSARKIGLNWGKKRFAKMSRDERSLTASKAANARWAKMNTKERRAATVSATNARLMKHKEEHAG